MTEPDPKTVREIARDALTIAIRRGTAEAVEAAIIAYGVTAPVLSRTFHAHVIAVAAEYNRLAGTLSWPDEQPQDERDGDGGLLERLEHHLGAYREDSDEEFIDNPVAYRWLTVGDQRAVVTELKQLRAEAKRARAALAEMTRCRDNALAYAEREHVPIELDDEIDIDGEELAGRIEGELLGPGWDWEDERTPGILAKQAVTVIRPHLARLTDQAQKARAEVKAAQSERDADVRAVAVLIAACNDQVASDSPDGVVVPLDALEQRFADRINELHARDRTEDGK